MRELVTPHSWGDSDGNGVLGPASLLVVPPECYAVLPVESVAVSFDFRNMVIVVGVAFRS